MTTPFSFSLLFVIEAVFISEQITQCKFGTLLEISDSSILFVIEAVFISEQIKKCRLGALLEISDTCSSKLNVFSYMIWQCWLN